MEGEVRNILEMGGYLKRNGLNLSMKYESIIQNNAECKQQMLWICNIINP